MASSSRRFHRRARRPRLRRWRPRLHSHRVPRPRAGAGKLRNLPSPPRLAPRFRGELQCRPTIRKKPITEAHSIQAQRIHIFFDLSGIVFFFRSFFYLILSTKLSASELSFVYTSTHRRATYKAAVSIDGKLRTSVFQRCYFYSRKYYVGDAQR